MQLSSLSSCISVSIIFPLLDSLHERALQSHPGDCNWESEDDNSQLACLDIMEVEFCSLGPGVVLMVLVTVLELYC